MIANPSIAFNEFSGSAKGVTARFTKGRTVLSVRSYPTGLATAAQLVSRNSLNKISRAYKHLSDSQQLAWGILAERLNSRTVLGSKIKLTPHNAFVRLNCNRALAVEGIQPGDEPGTVKVETRFILKWYRVFHIDDTTGIESLCQSVVPNPDISPIDAAEQAIQAYLTQEPALKFHCDQPSAKAEAAARYILGERGPEG